MGKECCNINGAIREFYDSLLAYTSTKIQDREVAEDIVQEVMYRFSLAYNRNEKINHIRGWLYQITKNLISDYYRKATIEQILSLSSIEVISDDNEEFMVIDGIIEEMIKFLPEIYSTSLLMSDIKGIPQKEISKILRISDSATKMRVQRGRKMLHEMIIECCDITYDKDGGFVSCNIKDTCSSLLHVEEELQNKYNE